MSGLANFQLITTSADARSWFVRKFGDNAETRKARSLVSWLDGDTDGVISSLEQARVVHKELSPPVQEWLLRFYLAFIHFKFSGADGRMHDLRARSELDPAQNVA